MQPGNQVLAATQAHRQQLHLADLRVEAPALRLERIGGKQLLPGVLLEIKGKEGGLCTQLPVRLLTLQAGVHLRAAQAGDICSQAIS